jgi:hypothetical protein
MIFVDFSRKVKNNESISLMQRGWLSDVRNDFINS